MTAINHGLYTDTSWAVSLVFENDDGAAPDLSGFHYVMDVLLGTTVVFRFKSNSPGAAEGTLGVASAASGQLDFTATPTAHALVAAGVYRVHLKRDLSDDIWYATGRMKVGKPGERTTYLTIEKTSASGTAPLSVALAVPFSLLSGAAGDNASLAAALATKLGIHTHGLLATAYGMVADFSAGTGTENTAFLQAAIAAALAGTNKTILFPPGHYYFNSLTGADPGAGGLHFKGAGGGATVFHFNEGTAAAPRHIFKSTSSGTKYDLTFEDIEFQGTLTTSSTEDAGKPMWLDNYSRITIKGCKFYNIAGFAMSLHNLGSCHVVGNWFENIGGDAIRVRDTPDCIIIGNYIKRTGDDAISLHSEVATMTANLAAGVPIRERQIVANNTIINTWRGIVALGARKLSITGNSITLANLQGILVNKGGTEGDNQPHDILIADNTVTDMVYVLAGVPAAPLAYIWIAAETPRGSASTNSIAPLRYDSVSGAVIRPYNHGQSIVSNSAHAIAPVAGVTISGNILRRTRPAGSVFSAWGAGTILRSSVDYDPVMTEASMRLANGIMLFTVDGYAGVSITDNKIEHVALAICVAGASADELGMQSMRIAGNIVRDAIDFGVAISPNAARHSRAIIENNDFDLDPYRVNANSNLNGTYDARLGPNVLAFGSAEGFIFRNNKVANACVLVIPNSKIIVEDNVAVMGVPVAMSFNTGNTGIGEPIADRTAWRYIIANSDPTSATYGDITNAMVMASAAMPAAGWFYAGWFVADTTGTNLGWKRLTTGSGHVLNTDWAAV